MANPNGGIVMNTMDQGWIFLFEVGLFWLITYVFFVC